MNQETLNKAKNIEKKINTFKQLLDCFEWSDPMDKSKTYSTKPKLIIDYNSGDEREQLSMPEPLNIEFIYLVKKEFKLRLETLEKEFKSL